MIDQYQVKLFLVFWVQRITIQQAFSVENSSSKFTSKSVLNVFCISSETVQNELR